MSRRSNIPRITGGTWKGRPVLGGVPNGVRPTSSKIREALGSRLGNLLPGAHILDAFAGAGLFSLEALSRGAATVFAIDKNPQAVRSIQKSLDHLDANANLTLRRGDTISVLKRGCPNETPPFDLVFIDPPYASGLIPTVLEMLISGRWIHEGSSIIVESSSRDEAADAPTGLAILNSRRYGDTLISVYCVETSQGDES